MRLVAGGALLVMMVVAAYWALLYFSQRAVMFPAPPTLGAPPRPADAEQVWLQTSAGRIEAWLLPPTDGLAPRAPVLLFTHGNGELIDYWPSAFDEPRRWGLAVLLLEYPGYGRSEGQPSERTITDAALAAHAWAESHPRLDPARIVAYGRSLGGSAAARLAAARPVAALILESAFTSARAFARQFAAPGLLVRDPFDTLAAVRAFRGPVLVLHGEDDDIVPADHGRALAAAAANATLRLLPCGHNDCPRAWPEIGRFLAQHGLRPGSPALDR